MKLLKTISFFILLFLASFSSFCQSKYGSVGGLESRYKDQYTFTAKLDERTNTLFFETDAPVTVVTLETYTAEEIIARKGVEYTNTYTKNGNKYSYDLSKPQLMDKEAYWLKVSIGRNGVPLAEYYFKKRSVAATEPAEEENENSEETKNASGATVIRTNATCPAGKTKLMNSLKALDGVQDVKIDARGAVTIKYSNDGTPYSGLLDAINENGFNANDKKTRNPSANPCNKSEEKDETETKVTYLPNLLDATGYKRAAIKYIPLKADYTKGYSDTKVYTWVDSLGTKHSGTGKEILDEVNKLEKQLNERGHSLREKKPFAGLNLPLAQIAKNDLSRCIITNKLKKSNGSRVYKFDKPAKLKKIDITQELVASTIYSYLGNVISGAEFRQADLNSSTTFDRTGNDASATMQLVFQPTMYQKIKSCIVEVSGTPGGTALFSTTVNTKKPSVVMQTAQYRIDFGDAVEPQYMPINYTMYVYKLFFAGAGNILPAATKYSKAYYIKLQFYDAAGKLVNTNQPNDLVLANQLPMPLNVPQQAGKDYAGFDYEFLDPGLHCFGFYARSTGFSADYFSQGKGYDGIDQRASVSANMEIGVKYYNWQRLINSNAPLTEEKPLFGYTINSEEKFSKPDNGVPPIRVRGYKKEDPDQGTVTLVGKSYDLRNTDKDYFSETIGGTIANVDFFIGPVPCNIKVGISGTASIQVDYQSSNYCDAKTTITPQAKITMSGSGGMDAKIMYAKVFANVDLLTVGMPYTLEASNSDKLVRIDPLLTVSGLSGEVYFQAGFCIPIPLVDDICESFKIDILNWKGYEKKFTIDPKKGISL